MANVLTITVKPESETNEDQARLSVDGKDWLGPEVAGLDPPMLATELLDKGVGTLLVGLCWCGFIGCRDVEVEVVRTAYMVRWTRPGFTVLRFNPAQYDSEVARFAEDRSWESVERAAAREIGDIFRGTRIKGGFEFSGVSTRTGKGFVHLSFRKGRGHRGDSYKVLKFRWDGASVADAIQRAKVFRAERFSHCD
jgi:hypothetical protein